ncbi:hypothetical protein AVEN_142956-1 [Araneus ventricosus]|uniref:Uncharacterized protein n=1 Tax=Araneus ventricosus TaxID=182803 RepID=A0A4Y2M7H5_ARAVE|nr:hypothetical protein AVEN_142956-1 [Araneus ventricosus]
MKISCTVLHLQYGSYAYNMFGSTMLADSISSSLLFLTRETTSGSFFSVPAPSSKSSAFKIMVVTGSSMRHVTFMLLVNVEEEESGEITPEKMGESLCRNSHWTLSIFRQEWSQLWNGNDLTAYQLSYCFIGTGKGP